MTWMVSLILTATLLFSSWFHRHHEKPAPPDMAHLHASTGKFALHAVAHANDMAKDHSELEPAADQVAQDAANLLHDELTFESNPTAIAAARLIKDMDVVGEDVRKMEGRAWALDHFTTT